MRYSLRNKLMDIKDGMRRRKNRGMTTYPVQDCLKGTMGRVIVVEPDSSIFRQAVFFLRDDYFRGNAPGRQELLRQAEEAAESFTRSVIPPGERKTVSPWLICVIVLSIAAAALIYVLCRG